MFFFVLPKLSYDLNSTVTTWNDLKLPETTQKKLRPLKTAILQLFTQISYFLLLLVLIYPLLTKVFFWGCKFKLLYRIFYKLGGIQERGTLQQSDYNFNVYFSQSSYHSLLWWWWRWWWGGWGVGGSQIFS